MAALKSMGVYLFWVFQAFFFGALSYCVWAFLNTDPTKTLRYRGCKSNASRENYNYSLHKFMQTLDKQHIGVSIDTAEDYMTSDMWVSETEH
ncbi:hypothetical protein NEAUS05_2264 [Nematocida ausubeli]|nr:hypothetical protein NEAUS07_2246 [Nematocida ausubeli]KAI5150694.1 hypothetical protein NEAUS05_2264 [Nematocida ausubeli]